jgi:hypothetical protein
LETRHGSMSEGFIKFRILFGWYSTTMANVVKNCSICYISKYHFADKPKMKHIII